MDKERKINVGQAVKKRCSKQVNQYNLNGAYLATYPSATAAGKQLGVGHGHIAEVCRGIWKTAYGFIWKYTFNEFPQNKDLEIKQQVVK